MGTRPYIAALCLSIGALAVCAGAEPPADAGAKPPTESVPKSTGMVTPIVEAKPEVYYLRNKDGELVFVPNFSFEEWEQLIRMARNLAAPGQPSFVLQDMSITGDVGGGRARLDFVFRVEQRGSKNEETPAPKGAWIRMPLRLRNAVLAAPPEFEGPGEHFVSFDDSGDGYVLWMETRPGTQHELRLRMLQSIDQIGDQYEMPLELPAPLVSTLELRVPQRNAEGTVQRRAASRGDRMEFKAPEGGRGVLTARGVRGDVRVQWHALRGDDTNASTQLDVYGAIVVTADEPLDEVRVSGRFVVRSFAAPLQELHVRLPPGMRYRDVAEAGYTVSAVAPPSDQTNAPQELDIRLDRATNDEVHIHLDCELQPDQNGRRGASSTKRLLERSTAFEPARFEFRGATRHRGNVDFIVKGDWELRFVSTPDLPRVEPAEDTIVSQYNAARFRYYRQPCALQVSLRRKVTRISIEPAYTVRVDTQQVRLEAELVCRTSSVQTPPIAIQLRGWTVETVTFDEGQAIGPLDMTQVNPLVVPVPSGIQALGRFTLRVEARRELTAGVTSSTQPLRVELPVISSTNAAQANLIVSPATVAITPADNVAITPRLQETQGLAPLATTVEAASSTGPAAGLRYRDQSGDEPARFVGDFRVRPRSVSVAIDNAAIIATNGVSVDQHFVYTVRHEPLTSIILSVPRSVVVDQHLNARVMWNDLPLVPAITVAPSTDRVLCEAMLPEPLIGTADLHIQIPRSAAPHSPNQQQQHLTIPLLFPATTQPDVTVVENRIAINYDQSLKVQLESGLWSIDNIDPIPGKLLLSTAAHGADVRLAIVVRPDQIAHGTSVQQAWVQTWFVGGARRDRAVFRVRSNQRQVTVELPRSGARVALPTRAAVDHVEIPLPSTTPAETLTLPVDTASGDKPADHVIEVWYTLPTNGLRGYRKQFALAQIKGVDHCGPGYWQLIVPPGDMLLTHNSQSVLARTMRFSWFGWLREPAQDQRQLEDLLGASHQDPIPSALRRYLLVTVGAPRNPSVTLVGSGVAVLIASGAALAIGLLLIYIPVLRHPLVAVVFGITLLAVSAAAPDVATTLGQSAILGIGLVAVAVILRRLARRRGARGADHSAVVHDSKMLEPQFSHSGGSSRSIRGGSSPDASTPLVDGDS